MKNKLNNSILHAYWALAESVAEFDHRGICQDDQACNARHQSLDAMKELREEYPGIEKITHDIPEGK